MYYYIQASILFLSSTVRLSSRDKQPLADVRCNFGGKWSNIISPNNNDTPKKMQAKSQKRWCVRKTVAASPPDTSGERSSLLTRMKIASSPALRDPRKDNRKVPINRQALLPN